MSPKRSGTQSALITTPGMNKIADLGKAVYSVPNSTTYATTVSSTGGPFGSIYSGSNSKATNQSVYNLLFGQGLMSGHGIIGNSDGGKYFTDTNSVAFNKILATLKEE